ncbi:hypothetical protein PHLGIDRAFT_31787 [Phlebiopsis gigantea 11061_1 CR5-6]|uniref:G domain-containing protein n=1 Tax=Phlebiopsis gigantea (strain 11061_1 CR5-6) TaxID=745531 RepID=A0A0C3S202_PHLG1|nr:hypothetical protein PHLGIDRAFT_31787 [Phlebiopsis gigantea 11061_1 CR5-6]
MPFNFKSFFVKANKSPNEHTIEPQHAQEPGPASPPKATILVMGPTGVGKSTFINIASNSDLRTSDGLMSCTEKVELSRPFELDGKEVVLVDSPGFDDTAKSDSDVLNIVTEFLASEYAEGRLFHGVLYLYRISDMRVSGTAARNMRFYRELCGADALGNSIIVTNMWGGVDAAKGEMREAELRTNPHFFKPALDAGARLARHDNTRASAHAIVRQLLGDGAVPRPLRVQRELVDERKRVCETAAGEALLQDLALLERKHLKEMESLEEEMAEAMREQDEEAQRELEAERERVRQEQAKLEAEKEKLMQLRRQAEEAAAAAASSTVVHEDAVGPMEEHKEKGSYLSKFLCGTLSCLSRRNLSD